MRIGRLSRLWPSRRRRDADDCLRCRTSFRFSPAKPTIVDSPALPGVRVVGALCVPCWRELDPPRRLSYYRQLWLDRRGADPRENELVWTAITYAVLQGG